MFRIQIYKLLSFDLCISWKYTIDDWKVKYIDVDNYITWLVFIDDNDYDLICSLVEMTLLMITNQKVTSLLSTKKYLDSNKNNVLPNFFNLEQLLKVY